MKFELAILKANNTWFLTIVPSRKQTIWLSLGV